MHTKIKPKGKEKESRSASGRHIEHKRDARQPIVVPDNRSLAESQGKIKEKVSGPAKHSNTAVFQRMAVMAVDDMNQRKDPLVWNNLQYAVTQSGPPVGDLKTNKVWSDLTGKQEIRIVEHGGVKKIGRKSAGQIANSMKPDLDRNSNSSAPEIRKVIFQSCYSGVDGGNASLASEMKGELEEMGQGQASVVGRKGIAFGFAGMGEKTARTDTAPYHWKNPEALELCKRRGLDEDPHWNEYGLQAYYDAMYTLRKAKTKSKNDVFESTFQYNKPWKLIGKSEEQWNDMNEEKRRTEISDEMAPYWKQLKSKMTGWGWPWKRRSGFTVDQYLTL
jgi:hypothetical protein